MAIYDISFLLKILQQREAEMKKKLYKKSGIPYKHCFVPKFRDKPKKYKSQS